jgi:large subunit ribosomal protein L10
MNLNYLYFVIKRKMAVTKQQKNDILADLTAKFKEAKSIGFASTNTLTVAEFGELRNELREVNASYTVAKKTLIKIALKDALDIEVNLDDLPGQIGAVCSNDDAVAGLGKVNDLVKKTKGEKVEWAVSIFEGELKDNESTKTIAGMPSRETLLGRLVGSMQSPLSGLARFFDAAAKDLEEGGKAKMSELEGKAPAAEEVKEEAPKVEEVKTEEKTPEAPAEEAKEEKKEEAA